MWAASSRIAILMVTPRRPQEAKHTKKERKKKRKLGENKIKQNKTKQNRTKKNIGGSSNRGCAKESERGMDGVEAEDQKGS